MASATPALNFIGAEVALALEEAQVCDASFAHLPGAANGAADWLSRRAAPGAAESTPPSELAHAKRRIPKLRCAGWYRLPAPGAAPELRGRAGE
eukprot:595092-Alexandrium_andersonii.AAC.1